MTDTTTLIPSSIDCANLEVHTTGQGPGLVIVPGGGTDASTYRVLADRLSNSFTVHRFDRRGRGRSAAKPVGYSLDTEIGDLASVLEATDSSRVIGHSVGGFFSLAAARQVPIERLALYDPAISVDGRLPSAFLPEFERLVAEGDLLGAMVVVGKGLENPGSSLPDPLIRASVRLLLKTPPGKTMARLLPTVPAESRLAVEADGPASAWASISSAVRFFVGERSPGYYRPSVEALAGVMPSADVEIVPRQGHDGIARAPKSLVASVTEFLSAGTA